MTVIMTVSSCLGQVFRSRYRLSAHDGRVTNSRWAHTATSRWAQAVKVGPLPSSLTPLLTVLTDYDAVFESIDGRIHFAGEGTNKEHPTTVAGAYLSALKVAGTIESQL